MRHPARSQSRYRQTGAATLIVVMVLFFIISLVAAYTNRSLIFEQRTSSNQYRSTQALEVADAGLEWAISQLNFERLEPGTMADHTFYGIRYTKLAAALYLVADVIFQTIEQLFGFFDEVDANQGHVRLWDLRLFHHPRNKSVFS